MIEEHLIFFVALGAERAVCDTVWHRCDGRGILSSNGFKVVFHMGVPIKKMNPEFFALRISVFFDTCQDDVLRKTTCSLQFVACVQDLIIQKPTHFRQDKM